MYGLIVESDDPFGEWPIPRANSTAAPDVRVRWHEPLPQPDEASSVFSTSIGGDETLHVFAAAGGTLWCYPDSARFWVDEDATTIHCAGPSHYVPEDLATYLLGPVLGFALRKRGRTILHASTVRVGEDAVAITGPAGAGKSTLTAALVTRGHRLIAEDVSVIEAVEPPYVAPGSPLIKLWSDSANQYGDLPLLTPNWEKRYLPATRGASAPLRRVFVIEPGPRVEEQRLEGRDAVVALLDNAYLAYALTPPQRARDLEQFAAVAEHVAVHRLTRTSDFKDLDPLCRIVEERR